MVCSLATLLCAACILLGAQWPPTRGLQSSWGYRGFEVKCDKGVRWTGNPLGVFPQTASKSQCLKKCFARLECESISFSFETGGCYLSGSTKEASGAIEDEGYVYCGPDTGEVWERTAITVPLPTTTTLKPTTMEPNECDSNPCQNGACTDGWEHFTCDCSPGYEGTICETNTNECSSNPCQNGGSCVDGVNQYSCSCVAAGYDGVLCENNIDECSSAPCQNGGICTDGINEFTCSCAEGYGGDLCDGNTNECASSPCQNGVCNDGINSYTCTCSVGYEGTLCETNTNECSSSPCQYGSCTDGVNGFTCQCVAGVTGTFCNVEPVPKIQLVNGPSENEGRVELWYNGQWGTVCDDSWDITDANVACRQRGYPYATNAYGSATYGLGTGPIHLDNTGCSGTETSLGACPHSGWGAHNCGHGEDSSAKCYQSTSIRLVNGPLPNEGRVEVIYNGAWGTVCDDAWDMTDGNVACRELGYPSAAQVWSSAYYGLGTGAIHLDNTACSGSESSLGACSHSGWGSHNCGHGEDSSLKCNLT